MTTIATRLGEFAATLRYEDVPADVLDKARACLAHGLLVGAAGRLSPLGGYAEQALGATDGPCHLLTSGRGAAAPQAVLVNATVLHSRVQEDTHGTSHLGTVVHPTALAIGEETDADGRELLTAIVVGYELAAALSAPGTSRSSARGFRASSVYGPFAAAAVAARLRGLDAGGCAAAVAYASAFAGGTLQSFAEGTPEWQFQNGLGAHNGVVAAGLAGAGAPSAPTGIEGPAGFLAAIWGTTDGANDVGTRLGQDWALREVTFKLFPVCAFNQAPVTLAARLAQRHALSADDVADVRIAMNAYEAGYPGMDNSGPFRTIGETQMSTRFCVGAALLHHDLAYRDLQRVDDAGVAALVPKVTVDAHADRAPMTARMTITTTDGRTLEDALEDRPETYLSWGFDQSSSTARRIGTELGLADADVDDLLSRIADLETQTAGDVLEPLLRGIRAGAEAPA